MRLDTVQTGLKDASLFNMFFDKIQDEFYHLVTHRKVNLRGCLSQHVVSSNLTVVETFYSRSGNNKEVFFRSIWEPSLKYERMILKKKIIVSN